MSVEIRVKRIYDPVEEGDGCRILVDRLWPRGVSKSEARIDVWPKEFTPSSELRQWFHADPERHAEFVLRYQVELEARRSGIEATLAIIPPGRITLVTATRDVERGHTAVLAGFLAGILQRG